MLPTSPGNHLLSRLVGGPAHPVTHHLREGDRLGAWVVLETPGHTPGHRSYWRPNDSVLILGDVLAHQHPVTQQVGLIEPLRRFTLDPALASLAIAEEQARARATLIVAAADVPLAIGSVYRRLRPRAVPPVGQPSRWSARAGHHSRPSGRPVPPTPADAGRL